MPSGLRQGISLLPLSQASGMIRNISIGGRVDYNGIFILLVYLVAFTAAALRFVYKRKNL